MKKDLQEMRLHLRRYIPVVLVILLPFLRYVRVKGGGGGRGVNNFSREVFGRFED